VQKQTNDKVRPRSNQKKSLKRSPNKNEGEGSYSATRRYDADVRDFVKSGKVDEAAQDAKRAIDGPDGPALSEAEKRGKRGPRE
jgi:hypothetical protein